jgi:transcriptional regulator with XRE-family HTH domain
VAAKPFEAFIGVLQAEQKRQGLSDARFARVLAISDSYWSQLQSDGPYARTPGMKLLRGALAAFPHTHPEPGHQPEQCVNCQLRDALGEMSDSEPIEQLLPAPTSLASQRPEKIEASA